MPPTDVRWHRSARREQLYDEVCLRRKSSAVDVERLLEAVQFLKERYKLAGDHVRSGYFHVSEMELKRRRFGRQPMRWLGREALYGCSSGSNGDVLSG